MSAFRRAALLSIIGVVVLTACTDDSASQSDIGEAEQVVTEATDRLTAAYAEIATDDPDTENLESSTAGCADGDERVTRRTVVPIQATDEPAVDAAVTVVNDRWPDNTDLDPGGDGRSAGTALTTFATDDTTGAMSSYSVTLALNREGYLVSLAIFAVTDGEDGATVVIDAYSDCLPREGDT